MTVGVFVTACEQNKYVWQILVNEISKFIILNKKIIGISSFLSTNRVTFVSFCFNVSVNV